MLSLSVAHPGLVLYVLLLPNAGPSTSSNCIFIFMVLFSNVVSLFQKYIQFNSENGIYSDSISYSYFQTR